MVTLCGTCVNFPSSAATDCSRMSLAFMTVSAAAELPCCKDGHLELHLAVSSAKDCQLGFEVGSESFLTYSKLSCSTQRSSFSSCAQNYVAYHRAMLQERPYCNDVHDEGQEFVTFLLRFQPLQLTLSLAFKGMCWRPCPPFWIFTVSQHSCAHIAQGCLPLGVILKL